VPSKEKHMTIEIIAEAILYFFLYTNYMVSCVIFVIFMGKDYKSEQKLSEYKEHINPEIYEINTLIFSLFFLLV
jgi:hypothetical protein